MDVMAHLSQILAGLSEQDGVQTKIHDWPKTANTTVRDAGLLVAYRVGACGSGVWLSSCLGLACFHVR